MDEDQHYDLALVNERGSRYVILHLKVGDAESVKRSELLPADCDRVELRILSDADKYYFSYLIDDKEEKLGNARTKYLSSEVAGGFTGVLMAMYAVDKEGKWAEFSELMWQQ